MTEFGSTINQVMDTDTTQPTLGGGATILGHLERLPATVVSVGQSIIGVQLDSVVPDGHGGWEFVPNPSAPWMYFLRCKRGADKGKWRQGGNCDAPGILWNHRDFEPNPIPPLKGA